MLRSSDEGLHAINPCSPLSKNECRKPASFRGKSERKHAVAIASQVCRDVKSTHRRAPDDPHGASRDVPSQPGQRASNRPGDVTVAKQARRPAHHAGRTPVLQVHTTCWWVLRAKAGGQAAPAPRPTAARHYFNGPCLTLFPPERSDSDFMGGGRRRK